MSTLRNFLQEEGFERIPLKKLKTGHYKFAFSVNHIKGEFIVDTGASTSCIGFREIEFFKLLSEESEIKAAGAGAINMETKIAHGNTLKVGKMLLMRWAFVLFDLSHVNEALAQVGEAPVQGIFGADLLKKLHAVIDYSRNCMYLKK
ncbi:MAG: retropepsin-like aspartic protease [Flavobacteriaceae bacterium]